MHHPNIVILYHSAIWQIGGTTYHRQGRSPAVIKTAVVQLIIHDFVVRAIHGEAHLIVLMFYGNMCTIQYLVVSDFCLRRTDAHFS